MYLSKIVIPWTKARNPYHWHDCLWQLFPQDPQAKRDFLFRVEQAPVGQAAHILMQSGREPMPIAQDARLTAKRDYPLRLREGQRLRFLLVANPVKTCKDQGEHPRLNQQGKPKNCRLPLLKEEEQRAWLERKIQGAAALEALTLRQNPPLYFRKKGDAPGKIVPVTFEGIIAVEDPAALQNLTIQGIGPAKGFGCGLLSVAKA